jgi:hypothetical protein
MALKCLRYTQLPVETILIYSRVNRNMICKNLTSWSVIVERYGFDEGRSGYDSMFELLVLQNVARTPSREGMV